MEHHMPVHLEDMLTTTQQGGVACLVVDVLASWALPVAARCGVPAVGFWPVMFASYRVVAAIPELLSKGFISKSGTPLSTKQSNEDEVNESNMIRDLHILPAILELTNKDLPWLVGGPASQQSRFAFWLRTMDRARNLRSILVNSFPGEGAGDSDRYDPPPGHGLAITMPAMQDEDDDYSHHHVGIPMEATDRSGVKDCIERVMEGEEGRHLQKKVNELREIVMAGEARMNSKT
ncbi:hypothetical protein EJB05_20647, partial [Eragrostis curvula]